MNLFENATSELLVVNDTETVRMDGRQLRRAVRSGQQVRVRRGVYVPADFWRTTTAADRYRLRVEAVVRTRLQPPILGYWSAAALWRYPRTTAWPADIDLIVSPGSGAHSRSGLRFHRERVDDSDLVRVGELLVTNPARTLIDLARTSSFRDAVVAADAALSDGRDLADGRVSHAELAAALRVGQRGTSRAARVVEFADGRADNPGETLSRAAIYESGFPAPQLQTPHVNPNGGRYFTDFEWPEHRIIGEFDGRGKYLNDDLLDGRPPGQVVYEEKVREDHLRAEPNTVVRWGWRDLHQPGRLIALLSGAGLPYRSRGQGSRS